MYLYLFSSFFAFAYSDIHFLFKISMSKLFHWIHLISSINYLERFRCSKSKCVLWADHSCNCACFRCSVTSLTTDYRHSRLLTVFDFLLVFYSTQSLTELHQTSCEHAVDAQLLVDFHEIRKVWWTDCFISTVWFIGSN